ncbi:MAG: glycosyltransferase family 4 protein [Chloroflexi bacterium]|nr:glycosyltransferase family 4 protein [Chloroflexota bacterium]
MRIGVDGRYVQDYFPGIARYTYNLAASLADIVENEIVFYYDPRATNSRYDLGHLHQPGKLDLRVLDVGAFSPLAQLRVPLKLWSDRIQVFHSPYYIKPYAHVGKSVVTIHDVIAAVHPEYLPSRRALAAFRISTGLALATATRIITPSTHSKKDLMRLYKVNPEKVDVIYEACDARFRPRDRSSLEHIRERYALPRAYVLYVGINKPHKNLVRLVEAFSSLHDVTSASLVIAGKEDKRYPQARLAAAKSPARDKIIFLGNVPEVDLPYIYNLADAFVFPSLYEGFGLPVLEAMASGVPVICSQASSLPEVTGSAGLMIDTENTDALAEAIARVLEDEALRQELRSRGTVQASTFSWHRAARQTLEAYERAGKS